MKREQRLTREHDPRVRRSLAGAAVLSFAVVVAGLVVVGLRVQEVHLGYRLDGLRAEHARLALATRQLEVQVATLSSPLRVEQRARQLGLTTPAREQIRLAREFVRGAAGLAALGRTRMSASAGIGTGPSSLAAP